MAKVLLIGVEQSDSLTLRYLTPVLREKGHETKILSFESWTDLKSILKQVAKFNPDLIGLSMVFNLRARDFCELSVQIRKHGFSGHITAGGFFAHFNGRSLLENYRSIDSVVYGEGEYTLAELADNLTDPIRVPGLCIRQGSSVFDTPPGTPILNLDALPFPEHQLPPREYLGIRESNVLASRGCWASCHFCCIQAWLKDTGLPRLRFRSPTNIADEIAWLYHQHDTKIFYFMDDNFLVPNQTVNIRRLTALKSELDMRNVRDIAIAVKCRPDCVDDSVFALLKEMGLIRVFLGIESFSQKGLDFLGRQISVATNIRAVEALLHLGVHLTYNILMFNPDSTMGEVIEDIDFITKFAHIPTNFCRTEVYHGTALEEYLRKEQRLHTDFFGYDYVIADPVVEAMFSVCAKAFNERNFGKRRLHEFAMQMDYGAKVLKMFHPEIANVRLLQRASDFVRNVNLNTCLHLRAMAEHLGQNWPMSSSELGDYTNGLRQRLKTDNDGLWKQGQMIWREMLELVCAKRTLPQQKLVNLQLKSSWRSLFHARQQEGTEAILHFARAFLRMCFPTPTATGNPASGIIYMADMTPEALRELAERRRSGYYSQPPQKPPRRKPPRWLIILLAVGLACLGFLAYYLWPR